MSKNGDIIIKDEDSEWSKDYDREANLKKIIEKATFIIYVVEKDEEHRCSKCNKSIRYEKAHEDGLCENCAEQVGE